ncbi:Hpt domain-containing protein [Pseudohoeflea suaedae]|uniref:Hpt domain-containing protein n=1 Tax=Pseudohoeflea suaedae TaxID=877384 RepID=A0A4R5PK13_9HYPH|nr:Hpt domain-containing protein [Pseudohoeflea suaedae]TDH36037.1 Hpt domain-containing protein [Pseudohoeflea suaedae]
MAAFNIACEAPDSGPTPRPSGDRPIDLVHLAKQTGGDKNLEAEVLTIFAKQIRKAVHELPGLSGNAQVRLAHTIAGSAKGVGAFEVARTAEAIENKPGQARLLTAFTKAVVSVDSFIIGLNR